MADHPTSATRNRRTRRAAVVSVISNSVLVVAKLVVGLAIGSVAVVSEAIHSAVDLVAALIAWFAVTVAGKPADEDHPYGHGKVENISAVVEALLIVGASAWIIVEAVAKLSNPGTVHGAGWGFAVMGLSAGVNILVSTHLMRVGKECDSIALQADAWHLRTDVYTSAGVMLAMGVIWVGASFLGLNLWWVDPVVAILVAMLILKAAFELTWQAGGDLMDRGLPPAEVSWICDYARSFLPRITGFHDLRTRKAGAHRFVDIHVVVDHAQTVGQAHEIAEELEMGVTRQFPGTMVTVHLDPCDARCPPRCLSGCLLGSEARNRMRAERGLPPVEQLPAAQQPS
jgi:cation diffusion facilitator family transporter